MAGLYVDDDRYGGSPNSLLVEAVRNACLDLVRRKLDESGDDWASFVFGSSERLITTADFVAVERRILDSGYRFDWSAVISQRERPDAYKVPEGIAGDVSSFSFEHPEAIVGEADAAGRTQRGLGDNVVQKSVNVAGTARYVRSSEQVIALMQSGVPAGTIAIIDDSGGTLTAPVLEHFAGIVCAGGTVRSHLGILAREYGIPCLMNARISGICDGDRVEIEATAEATTGEAYFGGKAKPARIWKIER
ncbi:MAG: PEP-utilizing enzyme [Gammaproteobacteria bacterium]|nr:PEP-utilizing enzyme [Gammaproteobacteria bacterium]